MAQWCMSDAVLFHGATANMYPERVALVLPLGEAQLHLHAVSRCEDRRVCT